MRSLPLRLRPIFGEPAHGALLRLAGRHGEVRATWFATSLGLDHREVLAGRHVLAIAVRAGLDEKPLTRFSPKIHPASRTVLLAGQEIALGDWSVSSRRACPACCAADEADASSTGRDPDWVVAHRAFMDVRSIGRCPVHRLPLSDACTGCGAALRWSRAPLGACPGGCRLAWFGAHGDLDVGLDAYFAARIGFGTAPAVPVLDALPFRRAVQLCERVGRLEVLGWARRLPRQTPEADATCRRRGFAMMADWPASIHRALDDILATAIAAGTEDGIIARYGWVYPDWLAVEDDEAAAVVAPLVRDHAVLNAVVARDEPMLGHLPPPTMTLMAAVRLGGMGFERTRALLDGAGAIPSGSRRGVAFALHPATATAVIRVARGTLLTREEAASRLGTSRTRVADLLQKGLLDREGRQVTASSVEALLRLLRSRCAPGPAPRLAVPLIRGCRGRGVSLTEACAQVVAGGLTVWGSRANADLSTLLVRPADLGAPRRELSLVAGARRVGVHPECMGQLVREDVVGRSRDGGVDAGSLEAFTRHYVPASQIAAKEGRSARAVIAELNHRDVLPAFGPPAFRQVIYLRAAIPDRGD